MKGLRVWIAASAAVILIPLCAVAYLMWNDMHAALERPLSLSQPELFEITPGQSMAAIAESFAHRGWIRNAFYLRYAAIRLGIAGRLQAGVYEVDDGETPRALLQKFSRGEVKQFQITLIEGATFQQSKLSLARQPWLKSTMSNMTDDAILRAIGTDAHSLEGQFFPSTYFYTAGTTDIELLKRAYQRMREVLARHWAERAPGLPYADDYQALIMASIVEKETARAEERPEIAGVFVRRLQQNMKLQTDPTVIYGLGAEYDGNLKRADLARDTPYNTYTRVGLPPTPIAMPGEASISAALNPAPGDALYFVAKGDGSHQFSASLEAHQQAVQKYQLRQH